MTTMIDIDIPSRLVLTNESAIEGWGDGCARLFEPYEFDEAGGDFAVLFVNPGPDAPTARPGYYVIEVIATRQAQQCGLMLMDAAGDNLGCRLLEIEPCETLEAVIANIPPA